MLQHESSLARGSLTAACLICSTLSYIGWTSINVFSISSESQFIGASRIVLSSTWWTAVCVRLTISSRQRLRSANRRQLVVPRHRRSKFDRRSFSVAAPMAWNSFPDSLRDPTLSIEVVPCYLCRQHFICHLHRLFGPTRLRTGPSVIYNICGRPCGHCGPTRCYPPFLRG